MVAILDTRWPSEVWSRGGPVGVHGTGQPPVAPTRLVRVVREEEGYRREEHGPCAFVPLIGRYGWNNET